MFIDTGWLWSLPNHRNVVVEWVVEVVVVVVEVEEGKLTFINPVFVSFPIFLLIKVVNTFLRYGRPYSTDFRIIIENLSTRVSWQVRMFVNPLLQFESDYDRILYFPFPEQACLVKRVHKIPQKLHFVQNHYPFCRNWTSFPYTITAQHLNMLNMIFKELDCPYGLVKMAKKNQNQNLGEIGAQFYGC